MLKGEHGVVSAPLNYGSFGAPESSKAKLGGVSAAAWPDLRETAKLDSYYATNSIRLKIANDTPD